MLRWLSSKHRRSNSSASGCAGGHMYRLSLDLQSAPTAPPSTDATTSTTHTQQQQQPASASNVPRGKSLGALRRRSLPAIHLQEHQEKSLAMFTNPPTFSNPLRRRGCCDHQHSEQMTEYRAEAIQREQATHQASFCRVPLEAA